MPLSGKIPLKSSQRRQRSAVFKGFSVSCLRFMSSFSLFKSFRAKPTSVLKYLTINVSAFSLVKPKISTKLSQHPRSFIPTFFRAVTTMWHLGSILPWMISLNAGNILVGNQSNPSSTSKTLDWFWRTNLKNSSFSSFVISRGRSCSSMASQRTDLNSSLSLTSRERGRSSDLPLMFKAISRHLSKNTTWKFEREFPEDLSGPCFSVAQS